MLLWARGAPSLQTPKTSNRPPKTRDRPPKTRASASASPNHTSTKAFQRCAIQKEALEFCRYANLSPAHVDYDAVHRALFIQTHDDLHCVIDLHSNLMSLVHPNTHGMRRLYREIARTKCVRTAERLFYCLIDEAGLLTLGGRGVLEFGRGDKLGQDENRELVVAMRFPLIPGAWNMPVAQYARVSKNHLYSEHELVDDLSQLMSMKVIAPTRTRVPNHEVHDW